MGLAKINIAVLTLGAAGAAAASGMAFRDPHPVVSVVEKPAFVAPAPVEASIEAEAIAGLDYDSSGRIVAARIDGLEPPAPAQDIKVETPVS